MNLNMRTLIIRYLRILKFMGAVRAKLFRGSLIMACQSPPGEGTLFEPHTDWIQKGKQRPTVELGHRLLIATDQHLTSDRPPASH